MDILSIEESNLKNVGPLISKKVKEKKRNVPDEKNNARIMIYKDFFLNFVPYQIEILFSRKLEYNNNIFIYKQNLKYYL